MLNRVAAMLAVGSGALLGSLLLLWFRAGGTQPV